MLTAILWHFGFANCLVSFFSYYLVGKLTQYSWNSFLSNICNADVGMGQDSAFSPILSTLYIASILHLFEQQAQALNLGSSILSFVNNSLLVSQRKTYNKTLLKLTSSYKAVTDLIILFGLVMEHDKLEIFHFSRVHNNFNPELERTLIKKWRRGVEKKNRIIVVTTAFSTNNNYPKVCVIILVTILFNMSTAIQEMGRAGKDGQTTTCYILPINRLSFY